MADKENRTIEDDVNANADLLIERINSEIQYIKDKEIAAFKAELHDKIEEYKENELGALRAKVASAQSQAKINSQRSLLKLRQELVGSLFDKVKVKIANFTNNKEDYRQYLVAKIQQNAVNYETGFFTVRNVDLPILKEILSELQINSEIKTDESIEFGGFKFHSLKENILIDETLDSSLNDQKAWFQNESGFII